MLQHRQPSRIFMEKNSCCVFGGISLMSCIMSCSNRTRPLLGLSTEYNWWDWAEHSKKNAHYYSRHDKIILLHDNARSHVAAPVKTYLETLKWEVLLHPPGGARILQTLLLLTTTCSDWWRMACLHIIWRYQKLYRWLHSLKRWSVLPTRYPCYQKEKVVASDGHYF